MATLESAAAKYQRKMASAAQNYNASKARAKTNWASGMSRFLGAPVSAARQAAYSTSIDAAEYRGGDVNKWRTNLVAKMTGG